MPPKQNSGSFMSNAVPGAGPALLDLLQNRQGGSLNQNTQSPNAVPPSSPPPMPQGGMQPSPPSTIQPQSAPQAPTPQLSPQDANTSLVLKALSKYLEHNQVLEKAQNGISE